MSSDNYQVALKWLRAEPNVDHLVDWIKEEKGTFEPAELNDLRQRVVYIKKHGHSGYILQYIFKNRSEKLYYSSVYDRYWVPQEDGILMEPSIYFSIEELIKLEESKADKQTVNAVVALKQEFGGSRVIG